MPEFLAPDAVRFDLLDDGAVLWLPTAAPPTAAPPADAVAGPWSLMSRRTTCIVDGPGDVGFLVPRMAADGQDAAPSGWDEAVERDGGCRVRFGPDPDGIVVFVPVL